MSLLMNKTPPPLFRDDPMREKSWGRHMGGSRGGTSQGYRKSGGCENPHSADPLLSSRVTKIPVKNRLQHGDERSGRETQMYRAWLAYTVNSYIKISTSKQLQFPESYRDLETTTWQVKLKAAFIMWLSAHLQDTHSEKLEIPCVCTPLS